MNQQAQLWGAPQRHHQQWESLEEMTTKGCQSLTFGCANLDLLMRSGDLQHYRDNHQQIGIQWHVFGAKYG